MISTLQSKQTVSRLICSSGGNAGNAAATCAYKLRLPIDVYVPTTTLPMMIEKLKANHANVIIGGKNWNEADSAARKRLAEVSNGLYVPPYDHPLIWEGNASIGRNQCIILTFSSSSGPVN